MKTLVTAALASSLVSIGGEPPPEILFLPEGDHEITPTVNGKPKTIRVKVPAARGNEIAARLQSALSERHAGNVRPHLAFQHQTGAASGIPKGFRYEAGKGIMCAVEWSGSGAAAIRNKDFSYFSPVFLIGDDGTPESLPAKGELGSLVNEPAFRNIGLIAASDTGAGDNRFYRDLVAATAGELSSEEEARAFIEEYGVDGKKTLAQRIEEREKAEAKEAEEAGKELEKRASQLVASGQAASFEAGMVQAAEADNALYAAAANGRGRKDTLKDIEQMREAGKPSARMQLDQIADEIYLKGEVSNETDAKVLAIQRNPELYQQSQDDSKAALHVSPEALAGTPGFQVKAAALISAGQATTMDEALGMVFASDPGSYCEYLKTLH